MTVTSQEKKVYKAVDIFSGAGGMSIGATMAGIEIALAVEYDKSAADSYEANHPEVKVIQKDITEVNPKEHIDFKPFVLFGGPPCQGFSMANTQTRNDKNKNNQLYKEFRRFAEELQPDWIVFENVEGITKYNKGLFIKSLYQEFKDLGYHNLKQAVLCAADYGVPQKRNRFFLIGNNKGIDFDFPAPASKHITVGEAFADLPELCNGDQVQEKPYKDLEVELPEYVKLMRGKSKKCTQNLVSRNQDYVIERYSYIGPGQNWKAIPSHLMENYENTANCHSGIYKRLDPDQPAVVISNYRKNMLIHPFQDRGLSVREAARLQSFPDSFEFKGTLQHIQQQIGNAVPPLLAKAIFEQIISASNGIWQNNIS
ncbi:DNA cytosine methyltransferase [Adhaeribacter soli]|uniref:DNA (cytosine-5-)-methyltransferase n=1 Tax=Adhaeribacter soli TaxID=2607655 RepID=A0A5N1IID3_9BACT|nr:DNA cytosine methyltransferase [Adhaeribacter soli]KAA9325168.1 DNA cytosine methyltransferase [Adhaeribacter soli]